MAVLERYDTPFDRWKKHDHSRHLSVDVVSRENMRDATAVRHDQTATRAMEPKFEPTIEQKAMQRHNQTNLFLLWMLFTVIGLFNPVFMVIGYIMGRQVNKKLATKIFVGYIVIIIMVVCLGIGIAGESMIDTIDVSDIIVG